MVYCIPGYRKRTRERENDISKPKPKVFLRNKKVTDHQPESPKRASYEHIAAQMKAYSRGKKAFRCVFASPCPVSTFYGRPLKKETPRECECECESERAREIHMDTKPGRPYILAMECEVGSVPASAFSFGIVMAIAENSKTECARSSLLIFNRVNCGEYTQTQARNTCTSIL